MPSHGTNRGSNPLRDANEINKLSPRAQKSVPAVSRITPGRNSTRRHAPGLGGADGPGSNGWWTITNRGRIPRSCASFAHSQVHSDIYMIRTR